MLNAHGDFVLERTVLVVGEAARRLGIDVDLVGLAPSRIRREDGTVVPAEEYRAVLRRVFSDPRETLGIELARAIPVEALGLWGFLLRTSPTFEQMLLRAERYVRVFFRYTRMSLSFPGDRIILACHHPEPSPFGHREQEICFFLGQWLTLGRTLIGEGISPEEVRLRWSGPAECGPFEAFYGCPVRFGSAGDEMVFPRRVGNLPLPEYTPELSRMFEDYAGEVIRRFGEGRSFADRVRSALAEALLTGSGNEAAVARRAGHDEPYPPPPPGRLSPVLPRNPSGASAETRRGVAAREDADRRGLLPAGLRGAGDLPPGVPELDRDQPRRVASAKFGVIPFNRFRRPWIGRAA